MTHAHRLVFVVDGTEPSDLRSCPCSYMASHWYAPVGCIHKLDLWTLGSSLVRQMPGASAIVYQSASCGALGNEDATL